MTRAAVACALVAILAGCAAPKPPPKPPPYTERITLLPNADGRPSAVIVRRGTETQRISQPYETVELSGERSGRTESSAEDVGRRYGALLEAQPARPVSYTLYFLTARTELTPQSQTLLREVRERVKAFPAAQISVIGHTDRVGTPEANDALSLKRAAVIRDMLVEIGVSRDAIEVVGRGERELLIQTPDGKAEERNRRVEVRLR